uniref:Transcription initiation factor IIB (Trinotate prediction) n=1 Tax=Henneguya salminicola TaxID=69463 RepID=A0A6G3MEC8_HENSL
MGGGNEASIQKSFKEISNMGERIHLTRNIIMRAQHLFKSVSNSKALRGRSSDDIIASCVYIACRQEGVPRSFKEICAASKVNKREIGRCFKLIVRSLEMNIEAVNSDDFIARFCSRLSLSDSIKKLAKHITNRSIELDLVPGRSPISIAATSICIAVGVFGKTPTFKEVCECTGCSESTIRQLLRFIMPYLKEIIPPDINCSGIIENMKC